MSDARVPVEGGCLCGAVRYATTEAPIQGLYCHCSMCRKSYGGLFQATLKFIGTAFALINGELKYYCSSNFARRGFCEVCGSPILFLYEGNLHVWVLLGSLDHPEDWPLTKDAAWGPSAHWYADTMLPWHDPNDGLPRNLEAPGAVAARRHADASPGSEHPSPFLPA